MNVTPRALILALATLVTTTQARAQASDSTRSIGLGLLGGITIPTGLFVHVAKTEFNIGGFVDFGRGGGPWALRLETGYTGFGFKDVISTNGVTTTIQNRYSLVNDNLNALYEMPFEDYPLRLLFTGGIGAYFLRNSPRCVPANQCITDYGKTSGARFGLNAGSGAEFGDGSFTAFALARWQTVFDAIPRLVCLRQLGCTKIPAHMIPLNVGFTFHY